MKGLLILVFCAVYSVQAWNQALGPVHITAHTGHVPEKYYPLSINDNRATRKASALVNLLTIVPQLNPLELPSLGPYHIALPEVQFVGDLHLTSVVVGGIRNLALNGLELRINPSRVDFNATLPKVSTHANFQLTSKLNNQPLNVNGQVSTTLTDLHASVAVGNKLEPMFPEQVYQIESGDVIIDLGKIQITLNMNQQAEEFRDILVRFLQHTDQYPAIVDDILRTVLDAINIELRKIPASAILQYLIGSGKPPVLG